MTDPAYGSADHYRGNRGEDYFKMQSANAALNAELLVNRFSGFVKPTDTVLDFGCGAGGLLNALDCSRRIGVEVNPAARRACAESGIECYASLEEAPDGVADAVVSNHALEHVPYPIDALRQARKKLKSGGILVLCVPMDDWRNSKRYQPDDRFHHLHTWTPQLLGNSLSEAGFEVRPNDVRILSEAWPRYYPFLYKHLPRFCFNAIITAWAILSRKRQIVAAVRPRRTEG